MINDCLVIIRSVGERTEQACTTLLKQLFPADRIVIVKESPFSEALRQSFRTAIEQNFPWTLCVDADVLVDVEHLPELIRYATEMDERIFQVQGLILDKFFQVWKPAGQHVYRTSLLEKAIAHIPEEGFSLRPETDMLNSMSKQGYPWLQCEVKVGVHDFEQYFADIYRKCFLHAIKHKNLITVLEDAWRLKAQNDFDFEVALIASQSGKKHEGQIFIDKSFNLNEFELIKTTVGIIEKPELIIASVEEISQIVADAKHDQIAELQERLFPQDRFNQLFDLKEKKKSKFTKLIRKYLIAPAGLLRAFIRKIWKKVSNR